MVECAFYPPHASLKPFIKSYFQMRFRVEDAMHTVFTASPDTGLLFYYGQATSSVKYDFVSNTHKSYLFNNQHLWLCGLHDEPIKAELSREMNAIFIMCTPLGVQHLLRDDATAAKNNGFSLETLGHQKKFNGLCDQLYEVEDSTEALKLAEAYLIRYFSPIGVPFNIKDMSPVANYIWRQRGMVQVHQLEEKFHASRRWLEKQFIAQIGFSPKEYARIIRFKYMLTQALATPSVCWGTLIEDFGYYDQSHLIRDFRAFTGQTPTEFVKMSPNGVNEFQA